jgi:hypothetical protein
VKVKLTTPPSITAMGSHPSQTYSRISAPVVFEIEHQMDRHRCGRQFTDRLPPGEVVFMLGLQDAIDGGVAQCDAGVGFEETIG